jgi:hypothetical protein
MARTRRERSPAPKTGESSPNASRGNQGTASDPASFTRWTGIFGGAGAVVALTGFYLLSQGSISLAPFLLAVAFLVLFPLALVK